MSARVTSRRRGWGGERSKRLNGYRLPTSKADWLERIAAAEGRPVAEISSFLVQQGLKIYERGSLLCDWPECKRNWCGCSGGPGREADPLWSARKVPALSVSEDLRTNLLRFPEKHGEPAPEEPNPPSA